MSSNSTRARKERTIQDRVSESLTEGDKAFIAELKRFSDVSNSTAGEAGASANNSPTAPAGNYLFRPGDTMLGPLALSPPLDFTIDINSDNTINISPLNGNDQYSSNIQLEDVPTSTTLDIVAGAVFDGQILILRTFAPNPITISQGTVANGGNIQTPDSNDVILGDLQMIILVFDEALVINENTGGTWRLFNTFGTGGVVTDASVATLSLSSPQTAGVVDFDSIRLGTGINQETEDGVFKLSGGIFQLNSSVLIVGTNDTMDAQWQTATDAVFTTPVLIGRASRSITLDSSPSNLSTAPISSAFVDARSSDVFVRLFTTNIFGGTGTIQTVGTWGQIFSIGGGTGGGDTTFPILYPQDDFGDQGSVTLNVDISGNTGQNKKIRMIGDVGFQFTSPPGSTVLEEIWVTFEQDGTGNHAITTTPTGLKNAGLLNGLLGKVANEITTFHFITEDGGVTFRGELVDLTTGGDTSVGSVATLALSSTIAAIPIPIDFNNNTIFGTGIIDRTDDNSGVFQLSGGIFQINSSISVSETNPFFAAATTQWERADNVNMTGKINVGTQSRVYNTQTAIDFSSTPVDAFTIDARTQDVFVRFTLTAVTGTNTQLEKIGTWAQIFSIGGGDGGGGDVTLPIRFPVTTGLPTTGNVTLNLNQTSGHYFTIGPLTGNIDIDIINPPAANTAQAFRINIIKGATDFTVTFNDTLLVQPFIGTENTTTLLAGDIYDGAVFNIFTMTSTAGSGSPTEFWSTFKAVSDVNMDTFDLFDIDSLTFMGTPGTLSSLNVGFSALGSGGFRGNILNGGEFQWTEENILLMKLSETANDTMLDLVGILSSAINLFETTTGKAGSILQGSTTLQYTTTGTQHEFLVGVESVAKITTDGLVMQGINFIRTPQIGFSQLGNIIQDDANGMIFQTIPDKDFVFRDGNSSITDTVATLDAQGLFLNKLFIQFTSIASPGVTGFTNVGELFMDTNNADHLSIIRNGSIIDLESGGDSNIISQGDSNVTVTDTGSNGTVKINIDGITNELFGIQAGRMDLADLNVFGFKSLSFTDTVDAAVGTILTQNQNDFTMNFPVNSDDFIIKFNSVEGFCVDELITRVSSTIPNTSGAALSLFRPDPSPQSGDEVGKITFDGRNTKVPQEFITYATWRATSFNVDENTETGIMRLDLIDSGIKVEVLKIEPERTQIKNLTTVGTGFVELALLKEDASSSAGDNIAVVRFNVLDTPIETDYARILGKIVNQNDAGSLQFDVRADDVSDVNALTIEGSATISGRTFVSLNAESRIGSDLKFQVPSGSTDLKIFPALNQLGIVVQDNLGFTVGSGGTLCMPVEDPGTPTLTSLGDAFGTHNGAHGLYTVGPNSIVLAMRVTSTRWTLLSMNANNNTVTSIEITT